MKRFFYITVIFVSIAAVFVSCSEKPDDTIANLKKAITGEVNSIAIYRAFSAKALEEGHKNIANVFRAVAVAEEIHLKNHNEVLKKMGESEFHPTAETPTVNSSVENLHAAIDGETNEFAVLYPDFISTAKKGNFSDAERSFTLAKLAEENHAVRLSDVLNIILTTENDKTFPSKLFVCTECGGMFTAPFTRCLICKADAERQFYQPRMFDADQL